ncbi:MAG: dependent oxidoreductase [Gammaproteobacteria bacterium]|nr:dependent oxidoreductase [Gammaproteobacteria bacterium]
MSATVPTHAQVVIVGGGIAGCSVAYHLTKLGWKDVVLLERGRLTCGTTWHAAGLITTLRASQILTELGRYTGTLFESLIGETGQDTGYRRFGSMLVARTEARWEEIRRMSALGVLYGIESHPITPSEAKKLHPLIDERAIIGGIYVPNDGQANPVDATAALAAGARRGGAKILEGINVEGFEVEKGRIAAVRTAAGRIGCEVAVVCAGLWTRDLCAPIGVPVPLYAAEHMYVVTEASPQITPALPILRDPDGTVYIKQDAGKLLTGCFEPRAKALPVKRLPQDQQFIQLPEDWEHFEGPYKAAAELVPLLSELGIVHFMNGPESFTPDNKFILGESPQVKRLFVAAGFNSGGVLSSAGTGKAIAEWIVAGNPTLDLSEVDIARFQGFQMNEHYLKERIGESLGLLYAMHWPYRQAESARGVRRVPLHDRLRSYNACFGEVAGWERANWYAPQGVQPEYRYSYGRQNWFAYVAEEHRAVRDGVGLFDLSSFSKYEIQGRDALAELQRLCANDLNVPIGRTVYTQVLNERGGIEADVTVTRLAPERFLWLTPAASQNRDLSLLKRSIQTGAFAAVTDVTSAFAMLAVMGPRSRELLERVSPADFSDAAFPFGSCRELEIGYACGFAIRLTYVGELGWELYVPTEFVTDVFDRLVNAGSDLGLKLAGYHALDSLRHEKAYRSWGHDLSPADTPLEAGLAFAVAWKKPVDFTGRSALEAQRAQGLTRRLVNFALEDEAPLLFHDEVIYRDGEPVGRISSGAFGYTLGRSVGLGYTRIPKGADARWIEGRRYEIDIAGTRVPACASLKPFYDPTGVRLRG